MDWLGSTRSVTDITGALTASQSYEAWGSRDQLAEGSPNWPTDMQFAGGWGCQSEYSNGANEPGLGLDYLQQRYYDPLVGRFMEPDPIGFAGGLNLFEYADNDPVNGVDPTGLDDDRPGWAKGVENGLTTIGAVLGGLGGAGVGGGGGFVAGIVTGPGAVVTAGAGGLELGAMGAAAGAAAGRATGHALAGTLMYFAARASGGSGGSSGGGDDASCPGGDGGASTRDQIERGIKSLQQQIDEHQQKLADYIVDPDAFDNQGLLGNAPTDGIRDRIIAGRIRKLDLEIQKFTNEIAKLQQRLK